MTMKSEANRTGILQNSRGFSLLEVLLGISVFMIGMLGVTALNISSLKSNTFSGNLSEATLLAARQIEEIMAMEFDDILDLPADDDGNSATEQDVDNDGMDDDDPDDTAADVDGKENFGLDDFPPETVDFSNTGIGKNGIYNVYYNVAENEPISTGIETSKTVNVIVEWFIKGEPRRINMTVIRTQEF